MGCFFSSPISQTKQLTIKIEEFEHDHELYTTTIAYQNPMQPGQSFLQLPRTMVSRISEETQTNRSSKNDGRQHLFLESRSPMIIDASYVPSQQPSQSEQLRMTTLTITMNVDKVSSVERKLQENRDFRQQVLNCHYSFIRYLSDHRSKLQYIAQHKLVREAIYNKKENKLTTFYFKVEKNDKEFKLSEQKTELWKDNNSQEVLNFIKCIKGAILQLQKRYLFHPDLASRNIIRRTENEIFIYKIIDFGFAFKVKAENQDCPLFACTKNIIKYLLDHNMKMLAAKYLFWQYENTDPSILTSLSEIWDSEAETDQKITSIMGLLQKYSLLFHKRQFRDILLGVLDQDKCRYDWQQIKASFGSISVTNLQQNQRGYDQTFNLLSGYLANTA